MKALTLLSAQVAEMSAAEVAAVVDPAALAAVRREDDQPMFVELIAGHEGISQGAIAGRRPAKKIWSRERVLELAALLTPGVPLFTGHGGPGRRPVGRMLAAAGRMISGALSAAGVAWISDPAAREELRAGRLDTCSIEAEVELHRTPGQESWVVGAVRRVTGVALGDSRRERPGFAGAAVRVIEEFEDVAAEEKGEGAPAPVTDKPSTPSADLAQELGAIRKELQEIREDLRRRDAAPAGDRGRSRLSVPPERERRPGNPLIPR